MEQSSALARTDNDYRGLQMVVSADEAHKRMQQLQAFVQKVMVRNEDYGIIPGTQKPTLYQPGAQKLTELYGLGWRFTDVETVQDWQQGFFFYRKKCAIFGRRDGHEIGEGLGSCNSREDKYAWRWVFKSDVPKGLRLEELVSKERTGKKGKYSVYRLPNPDLFSVVNTIEKMAAKRAFVAAVISATRSAGLFTQDLEDLPKEAFTTTGFSTTAMDEDDREEERGPADALANEVAALVAAYAGCPDEPGWRALEERRRVVWGKAAKDSKAQLKAAADAALKRLQPTPPPKDEDDPGSPPSDREPGAEG